MGMGENENAKSHSRSSVLCIDFNTVCSVLCECNVA